MKICLVHNSYEQPGGEDVVFEQESTNLKRWGHDVIAYHRSNTEIGIHSPLTQISFMKDSIWSASARKEFSELLDREAPDIVHVHNTFFVISPSIYSACKERGIPVVQTLHNFRLLCPAYSFYRDGHVCEECIDESLWAGIRHGCYRGSKAATAGLALILSAHRLKKTWDSCIDCYIALTEFSRAKFISAGFQPDKIVVKPNFVGIDPGERTNPGAYALYAGRLSPEKGIETLLRAWKLLPPQFPLQIIGDGPERAGLEAQVRKQQIMNVIFRGSLTREQTVAAMKEARFLVVPSVWYEGFPMVIAEAMACGIPVVCSRLGAMEEIVADRRTGLHFNPGDPEDLAQIAAWAWTHPAETVEMGRAARKEYERHYTPENNYFSLIEIYGRVLDGMIASPYPSAGEREISPLISH
jgi:glycosyltransferase involved in cell wall biosynthesis